MSVMRFLISGLALAAAQSASAGAQEVIIFEHNNYQGRSVRLTADAPNLDRRGFNDRASSIRVVSGTWEFCQHANFGGSCFTADASQNQLGGFNDHMSSVRLVSRRGDRRDDRRDRTDDRRDRDDRWDDRRDRRDRGGRRGRRGASEIVLYSGPNYTGQSITLRDGANNLRNLRFNDRARSIRVYGRGSWRVCQHRDFGGACMQVADDMPYISGGMSAEISSVAPDDNANRRGTRPREGVWLYDGREFEGRRFDAIYDVPNLDREGFNDRADSIIVARGETWEVCEHANYRGRCEIVDSERIPNLAQYGFQNRISSMRRVNGYDRW